MGGHQEAHVFFTFYWSIIHQGGWVGGWDNGIEPRFGIQKAAIIRNLSGKFIRRPGLCKLLRNVVLLIPSTATRRRSIAMHRPPLWRAMAPSSALKQMIFPQRD